MKTTKKILTLLIIFLLIITACRVNVANKAIEKNFFYGTWKITQVKAGLISAITLEEAKQYIGSSIFFSESFMRLLNKECQKPIYKINKQVKANDYLFKDFRIDKDYLGIKNDLINILNVKCNEFESLNNFIVIDRTKIIYSFKGMFFILQKVNSNYEIKDLYGNWELIDFKLSQIRAMTIKEVEEYIGKQIVINDSAINYFGKKCSQPTYKIINNFKEYFYYGIRINDIEFFGDKKISNIIEANCSGDVNMFFIINNNEVITPFEGVFFYLRKLD